MTINEDDRRQRNELAYLQLCRLLERRGESPHCITQLCAEYDISVFTLNRLFKKWMGMTPNAWQRQCRLNEAAILLVRTAMDILSIAQTVGYESQQSFTRAFTQRYKLPPHAYRQEFSVNTETAVVERIRPVVTKTLPTLRVWGARYLGDYDDVPAHWQHFAARIKPLHAILDRAQHLGITWDDPAITPAGKIRYDCALIFQEHNPVLDAALQAAGLQPMALAAGGYAGQTHHGAYLDAVCGVYPHIVCDWLPNTTWSLDMRPALEWYDEAPWRRPADDWHLEVMIPIL